MLILKEIYNKIITHKNKNSIMQKLKSFDQFSVESKISHTRKLEEEKIAKRTNEAELFKALLSEYKVSSVKELTKEQRSEFFNKLRGAELNESIALIEEGTRGQFGKIDKKGNIVSVYTHYDSYPENMLPIIKKTFAKGQNVDDVLAKGDNSGLEADINKMNFYGGKVEHSKGNIGNISKYLRDVANNGGAEYVYLWDEGKKEWFMADIYGRGYDDIYPAFEALSVSVNEAIQVELKRGAKKVVTVYNNLFAKKLTDLGAMSQESILGCIKYLFEMAMEDANFSREGFAISKNIRGFINTFEVKMPGLGNHFIKIGATTVKRVLDKHYADIAMAADWAGLSIVEGTALYLEQIKQEAMGQSLLNAFNTFNESKVNEATVEMDAMDPDNKDFLKFLKKHKVEIIDKRMDGPGGGHPVITMQGKRKDLEAVLADEEFGWADPDLAEYIEEGKDLSTIRVTMDEQLKINEAIFKAKDFQKTLISYAIDPRADEIYILKVAKVIESGFPSVFDAPDKRFHVMAGMMLEENWLKQYDKLPEEGDILPAPKKDKAFESTVTEKKEEIYRCYVEDDRKPGGSDRDIKNDYDLEVTARDRRGFWIQGALDNLNAFIEDYNVYLEEEPFLVDESKVNEAEVKSDEEFNEYAVTVLQKAFGDEYDEVKAKQVIDGILAKAKGDYGVAVGMLTSSLG